MFKLFHDRCPSHTETSLLIFIAYQRTAFYMIGTSVMKKLSDGQNSKRKCYKPAMYDL